MEATEQALVYTPGRVTKEALEALYGTGHWLHSRHRFKDAAAVFRVMVLCSPEDERGYLALGACHEGLGQDAIALEIYATATMATVAPRCQVGRARLLRKHGREDDAEEALDEVWDLAEARDDDTLRALVLGERGTS